MGVNMRNKLFVGAACVGLSVLVAVGTRLALNAVWTIELDSDAAADRPLKIPEKSDVPTKTEAVSVRTVSTARVPAPTVTKEPSSPKSEAGEEDRQLNEVVEQLLEELSLAQNDGNKDRILDLIGKLRSITYGSKSPTSLSGGRMASVKRAVLAALSNLGAAGLDQVLALVNDPDVTIAQTATDLVFKSLQDLSLGDYKRADIVVAASAELTDTSSILKLYQEFIKMRHSVGVETLTAIAKSGTPEAKAILPNTISAFTRDVTITEADQLADWLKGNPDSEIDAWFYGPIILQSQQ